MDFPGGSDGKVPVYNGGDLGSIPGLGRSPGEGIYIYIYIDIYMASIYIHGFPGGTSGKESACRCRRPKSHWSSPWIGKVPPEEGMATHSSTLGQRCLPGRL